MLRKTKVNMTLSFLIRALIGSTFYSNNRIIGVPDFYLPNYGVYVEYWGLVDAEDAWTGERYERNMRKKMALYYRNQVKFISIYPSNLENLDWIFRKNSETSQVLSFLQEEATHRQQDHNQWLGED